MPEQLGPPRPPSAPQVSLPAQAGPPAAESGGSSAPAAAARVGWRFVLGYAAAYTGAVIVLISPLLVTLALKLEALVGDRAPNSLALVGGVGGLVSMVGNPLFGRLSDRTSSRYGMRRPWMLVGLLGGTAGTLLVAAAPDVPMVLLGWCLAQLFFNAVLASLLAVLPDQVPPGQRGLVSGVLGICLPVASVCGTFLVQAFSGHLVAMFLAPCVVGGCAIVLFAARLDDRRLAASDKAPWSWRELPGTFVLTTRAGTDFLWAFTSRFLFVFAYALLTSYETFYLLDHVGSAKSEVPRQVFVATVIQSVLVVGASLAGGTASDRTGRRKVFVFAASAVFGLAMFVLALATGLDAFFVAMAISGLGLGLYVAVDLALVVDVLPDRATAAKDLGVFNIAGALPYSLAPAVAPAFLAVGGYGALYTAAGLAGLAGAVTILRVRGVR
jgi:MFS family permease